MDEQLISWLGYGYAEMDDVYCLPAGMQQMLRQADAFFSSATGNKLCFVLPAKERAAQWLSLPVALDMLKKDFERYSGEIYQSYQRYQRGEKLILNEDAIVEWDHYTDKGIFFRTKAEKESSGALIQVKFEDIIKLKPAPAGRNVLSAKNRVMSAFAARNEHYLDQLLQIRSRGNNQFIKRSVCLAGKFKNYEEIEKQLTIDGRSLGVLIAPGKIDDQGNAPAYRPLLLTNNLSALSLYSTDPDRIAAIILDGAGFVDEERTNFSDIDAAGLPTILITDLSESACFPLLVDFGFEFLHLTPPEEDIRPSDQQNPFFAFDRKVNNYFRFTTHCKVCHDEQLELLARKIHLLKTSTDDQELNTLKVRLVILLNQLAALVTLPEPAEKTLIEDRIEQISDSFERCRIWLGPNETVIGECLDLLRELISTIFITPPEKQFRLMELLAVKHYDVIICRNPAEIQTFRVFLQTLPVKKQPAIITVDDLSEYTTETSGRRALVTGWLKIKPMERLLSCFLFTEIDFLFYTFENNYYTALARRIRFNEQTVQLPKRPGIISDKEVIAEPAGTDIFELELQEDAFRFARYTTTGDREETLPAMRLMLDSGYFIYGSDSHKFLVLTTNNTGKILLHYKKTDQLKRSELIAIVNTDTDILIQLVEKSTSTAELKEVKYWAGLWKELLKAWYQDNGSDFRLLIRELRANDCIRHEGTIRSWLFDETRIGPDDNSDLISIALLTGSELLLDKIPYVRKCISLMTGWRMKAADKLRQQLLDRLTLQYNQTGAISENKTLISGLGSVQVLRVVETTDIFEEVDLRYVNKLLQTDAI
jgi:hypothetical protein